MDIGFIGCGKLGGPCADTMIEKGHTVYGYDPNPLYREKHPTILPCDSIAEVCFASDIVFIAVPTPHEEGYDGRYPSSHLEPKDFNYDTVKEVLTEVKEAVNADDTLIVLISTVLPGTIRREFADIIEGLRFIYNPYLIAMGTVGWDLVNPEMVMIGTNDGDENGDAKLLIDFYNSIMENDPRIVVGTWDECECIKIFYNSFISTKLSLVNMIQDVAEIQGNIDVDVVTKALAESTHRIMSPMYMKAGMGDGGACHPRDNIALRWMAKNLDLGYDIFESIMTAREVQAKRMAKALTKYQLPVVIIGKSYKPGVPYEDGSYSVLVGHFVSLDRPVLFDTILDEPAVYLLAHPQEYFTAKEGSIVVDPWRQVISNCETVYYGKTR